MKTKEVKITKRRNKRRMIVKITKTAFWYKKGQLHEVGQYITKDFLGGVDCYERNPHRYGIETKHCKIIKPV